MVIWGLSGGLRDHHPQSLHESLPSKAPGRPGVLDPVAADVQAEAGGRAVGGGKEKTQEESCPGLGSQLQGTRNCRFWDVLMLLPPECLERPPRSVPAARRSPVPCASRDADVQKCVISGSPLSPAGAGTACGCRAVGARPPPAPRAAVRDLGDLPPNPLDCIVLFVSFTTFKIFLCKLYMFVVEK